MARTRQENAEAQAGEAVAPGGMRFVRYCFVLLLAGMALPLLTLLLFAIDLLWAPFAAEMTYPAMLCWVLWPVLIAADFAGLLLGGPT